MAKSTSLDELVGSFLSERSPLYPTFIFSWALWNWRFFYVTLFISAESIPDCYVNKLAYASSFLTWHSVPEVPAFIASSIVPIVITYLIIWWLPRLNILAYQKHADHLGKRREEKYNRLDKKRLFTFSEFQNRMAGYRSEVEEVRKDADRSSEQRRLAEEELSRVTGRLNEFKILSAKFGNYGDWSDVIAHKAIIDLEAGRNHLTVNTDTLPDPIVGSVKILVLSYQGDGEIHYFTAVEHDRLRREGNKLVVDPGNYAKYNPHKQS